MRWMMSNQYRKFMAAHQLDVLQEISSLQSDVSRISVRIKQLNSIEYKIYRYNVGELRGKVPINKCLNDLFGMRIIMDDFFTHDDLKEHYRRKLSRYEADRRFEKRICGISSLHQAFKSIISMGTTDLEKRR